MFLCFGVGIIIAYDFGVQVPWFFVYIYGGYIYVWGFESLV